MPSERNTLRYGNIHEVLELLEMRPPKDMDEVRAALTNLFEQLRALDKRETL